MERPKLVIVIAAAMAMSFVAACHDGSGFSSDRGSGTDAEIEAGAESQIPTFESISDLPYATGRMAEAESSEVSANLSQSVVSKAAIFDIESSSSFGSIGACETLNILNGILGVASWLDRYPCILKYVELSGDLGGIDIYDENWHIIQLDAPELNAASTRVKLKVEKGEGESIESLKMFLCRETSEGVFDQFEYIGQEISGASFTQNAVGQLHGFYEGEEPVMSVAEVSGEMDGNGAFLVKRIVATHSSPASDNITGLSLEATLDQMLGQFIISGYRVMIMGDGSMGMGSEVYAAGGISGDMLSGVSLLSMLLGSVNSAIYDADGSVLVEDVMSWLEEGYSAVETASDGVYYASVADSARPQLPTEETLLGFSYSQSWNCEDDEGVGMEVVSSPAEGELSAACDAFYYEPSNFMCLSQGGGGDGDLCQEEAEMGCTMDFICCIDDLVQGGLQQECIACFPDGEPDANTLTCLIEMCGGYQDCVDGMNAFCGT